MLASKPAPFQSDLVKAIGRASGWSRRDLTGASVFVVCGEIDFVEFTRKSTTGLVENLVLAVQRALSDWIHEAWPVPSA